MVLSVRCPVRAAQCGCPVWGAQCPVKGHYWTPGARRKKGGWLGRPGQARPQGSRTSQGSGPDSFHSSFSFSIFLVSFFISIPLQILNSFLKILQFEGPLSLVVVYPSSRPSVRPVSALEMLPGPDIEQILEALPLLGDHTIPYHTISFLGRPDKKQWRTKGRMVAGDMADQETKSEENQQNKGERGSW